jgi:hypothetical protein
LLIVGSGATLKHEFFMVSNETTNPSGLFNEQ